VTWRTVALRPLGVHCDALARLDRDVVRVAPLEADAILRTAPLERTTESEFQQPSSPPKVFERLVMTPVLECAHQGGEWFAMQVVER
jgi:hypothetical protein